ncbi:MAG: 3-isopropylmalate dehydratase small subunit [Bacteroidales bacterium]
MMTLPSGCITLVSGTAIVLRGDDIDTDRIMPARFLRALTFDGMGEHVFEDDRAEAARAGRRHPFDEPASAGAAVLLVNRNFGCGSSREHAPQGLLRRGIRAIVGEGFSEIFFGNATTLGVPCLVVEPASCAALMNLVEGQPATRVTVDLGRLDVAADSLHAKATMPEAVRAAFLDGTWDGTALLLDRFDEVRRTADQLPYIGGWRRQ